MICGLPGSGKTTLAKKLESERNAILLNADGWIIGIVKSKSDIQEIDRLRDPMEQLLWNLAQKIALNGTNVILDNGFWTKSERNTYLETARKLNLKIELYYLKANKDIILKRLENRNSNVPENDFQMDMNKMERWIEIFEPPTDAEIKKFDFYKLHDQK